MNSEGRNVMVYSEREGHADLFERVLRDRGIETENVSAQEIEAVVEGVSEAVAVVVDISQYQRVSESALRLVGEVVSRGVPVVMVGIGWSYHVMGMLEKQGLMKYRYVIGNSYEFDVFDSDRLIKLAVMAFMKRASSPKSPVVVHGDDYGFEENPTPVAYVSARERLNELPDVVMSLAT